MVLYSPMKHAGSKTWSSPRLPPTSQLLVSAIWLGSLAAATLHAQTSGAVTTVRVPATSNPYLAGMPSGTKARVQDKAPEQSPVLIQLSLVNAAAVSFTASGGVDQGQNYCPPTCDSPNGSSIVSHQGGPEHGISDLFAPLNSLVGVFLGDDQPDVSHAPKPLILRSSGIGLLTLSPQLKQVYFIGTGVTKTGASRRFVVPKDATRLFLGIMAGSDWCNNQGSFSVTVTIERSDLTTGQ
jgi:hypothetical protein